MNQPKIEKPSSNNFFTTVVETASEAFTQEIFLFIFVATAIFIRKKILHYLKLKKLKTQYFGDNAKSDLIHATLIKILTKLDADRVILLQFHNGNSFFSNFDQLKVSMTHQVTQPAIKNIENIISLPISLIHREIELCRKSNNTIQWINKDATFVKCAEYLDSIGVELYGVKMLFNKYNIPVGLLGIHYCSKDYLYVLSDESKTTLLNDFILEVEKLL